MKVTLEFSDDTALRPGSFPSFSPNKIAHAAIQIVRMPEEGKQQKASVGDKIEGRVVLQYLGPLTLTFEQKDAKSRKPKADKATKSTGPKRSKVDLRSDRKGPGGQKTIRR